MSFLCYYCPWKAHRTVFHDVPAFPSVHSSRFVKHELVANYSLLYTVLGSDRSLAPYMLCAHLDVVPADRQHWDADPFSGDIIGDYIYGRGAIDDKQMVMVRLWVFCCVRITYWYLIEFMWRKPEDFLFPHCHLLSDGICVEVA